MSNSKNMTVAERLAQRLKSSPLGELFDEDDLAAVTKEAIQKAFFEHRHDNTSSYNTVIRDPLIVEIARDALKAEFEKVAREATAELAKDPAFRSALIAASVQVLPALMTQYGQSLAMTAAQDGANQALSQMQAEMQLRFGR